MAPLPIDGLADYDDAARHMLIFDFDGVLADTEPLHFAAWNQAFQERLGLRLADDHRVLVGLKLHEMYQLWLNAAPDRSITLTEAVKQQLLERKTELFFAQVAARLTPMPGSVALLRQAHALGWYTAIASRSARLRMLHTLDMINMPALFDLVLGAEEVVDPVSRRKIHARAAHLFGIDPAQSVVIEDSASGVSDARDSGIGYVIGLTTSLTRDTLLEAGAHQVVDHLTEIALPIDFAVVR